MERHTSPSDGRDDAWSVVAPSLTVMTEDAPQREQSLRDVFNGVRWMVRMGAQWRMMSHAMPPWAAVSQQTQRWLKAGVFEAIVNDLRAVLRLAQGRNAQPSATMCDRRTLPSSPESGHRAGSDGATRRTGSNVHLAGVPWDMCWLCLFLLPMRRIALTWANWLLRCKTWRAIMSTSHTSITGTRAMSLHRQPQHTGDVCTSSQCLRPRMASFCCRVDGSWSAVVPGPPGSVGWLAMTRASHQHGSLAGCLSRPITVDDLPPRARSIGASLFTRCSRGGQLVEIPTGSAGLFPNESASSERARGSARPERGTPSHTDDNAGRTRPLVAHRWEQSHTPHRGPPTLSNVHSLRDRRQDAGLVTMLSDDHDFSTPPQRRGPGR
jgi:transposase